MSTGRTYLMTNQQAEQEKKGISLLEGQVNKNFQTELQRKNNMKEKNGASKGHVTNPNCLT